MKRNHSQPPVPTISLPAATVQPTSLDYAHAEAQAEAYAHAYNEARSQADAFAIAEAQFAQSQFPEPQQHTPLAEEQPTGPSALTPVYQQKEQDRKQSALVALASSIFGILLICGALYLVKIFTINSEPPQITTYHPFTQEQEVIQQEKVTHTQRTPSAPPASAASARMIAASLSSDVSIPLPEISVQDFGNGDGEFGDFGDLGDGQSWATGSEAQTGNADAGGFGSASGSGLKGRLYDFKQDRNRKTNAAYVDPNADRLSQFVDNVNRIHKKQFSSESLEPYFQAPNELTLTHLAVSNRPAAEGPLYFGAEKDVQPKGWIAHYNGKLIVPETGHYRLSGMADDYLSVFADGKPWLHACWPEVQRGVGQRWRAHRDSTKWTSPIGGQKLIFGPWKKLSKGQVIDIDLGIGERPGGMLGFVLMVEQKGVRYEREKGTKRPILPLFATSHFSEQQQAEITKLFPNFPFEWEKVPVFRPAENNPSPLAMR